MSDNIVVAAVERVQRKSCEVVGLVLKDAPTIQEAEEYLNTSLILLRTIRDSIVREQYLQQQLEHQKLALTGLPTSGVTQ